MADLPFMPMYVDAMLGDTGHLSNEEFGAYHRLLYAMWRRGGTLPDVDGDLMRICCSTPHRWPRLRSRLRPFLIRGEDGTWSQKKLKTVMAKSKNMVATNHEKTAKAREAKANKKKHLVGDVRSVTDPYDRRRTASVRAADTSGNPNPEGNKALPQEAESLITDAPTADAAVLPPRANGKVEGSAPDASHGLEGRSAPEPDGLAESPVPPMRHTDIRSGSPEPIEPTEALLRSQLVKAKPTGLMAALQEMPKEDEDET